MCTYVSTYECECANKLLKLYVQRFMNVCMNMFGCGCMCVCSRRMDVFKHNMYRGSVQAHVHAKVYNIVMVNIEI